MHVDAIQGKVSDRGMSDADEGDLSVVPLTLVASAAGSSTGLENVDKALLGTVTGGLAKQTGAGVTMATNLVVTSRIQHGSVTVPFAASLAGMRIPPQHCPSGASQLTAWYPLTHSEAFVSDCTTTLYSNEKHLLFLMTKNEAESSLHIVATSRHGTVVWETETVAVSNALRDTEMVAVASSVVSSVAVSETVSEAVTH